MAFAFSPYWNKIIVSRVWVLVFMGSVWVPQIISLAIMGKKNTIDNSFIVLSQLQSIFLPLYINLVDGNILFFKPDVYFFGFTSIFLILQLMVLHKQRKQPRFFMPRIVTEYFDDLYGNNFYRYERNFENEAEKSTSSGGVRPILG